MRYFPHALIITIFGLSSTANADPPVCERWNNYLSDCEALGIKDCNPTGLQQEVAKTTRFSGTALDACKKLIKKAHTWNILNGGVGLYNYTPGEEIRACHFGSTNTCHDVEQQFFGGPDVTFAYCVYNTSTDDSDIDWDDATTIGMSVQYELVTPEPHCFCTANGPYTDIRWQMDETGFWKTWELFQAYFFHRFPRDLKAAILDQNRTTNPFANNLWPYLSDAIVKDSNPPIWFDPNKKLQKWSPENANAVQIDHIIPRVDSQGCLCGDVTPNNAAVISLELNQTMLNISPKWNADRAKMYAKYVTCPDPSVAKYAGPQVTQVFELPIELATLDEDETTRDVDNELDPPPERRSYVAPHKTDEETGGCSTGSAGGIGLALALLAFTRRFSCRR